jgi:ribosomal protein L10
VKFREVSATRWTAAFGEAVFSCHFRVFPSPFRNAATAFIVDFMFSCAVPSRDGLYVLDVGLICFTSPWSIEMPVSDKKREYAIKLRQLLQENRSVLIVECDNVGSKQMQSIRVSLRGTATILMGKNTTIRKVLKDFLRDNPGHPTAALNDYIVGNTGFVFTNADLSHVRDVVASNKVPAPARVGSIAPVDVFVEPGPTGCDPGQTAWFQALNIPTKVWWKFPFLLRRACFIRVPALTD